MISVIQSDQDNDSVPIGVNPELQPTGSVINPGHTANTPTLSPTINQEYSVNQHERLSNDSKLGESKRAKSAHSTHPGLPAQIAAQPPTAPVEAVSSMIEALDITHEISPHHTSPTNMRYTSTRQAQPQPVQAVIPPIPVDALDMLQRTSSYLRMSIMNKDAPDREDHLLAALGNLTACLEAHFIPHMDAWRASAMISAPEAADPPLPAVKVPVASTSTSSKKYRNIFNQENDTTPTASTLAPIPEHEPTHPDLEAQLLDARVALVKYEQEFGIKDDQIAQANQEIERLNTRYTDMTDYIESGEPAILMLKESSKKHIEKMNRQRVQIDNLHIHNRRLKSMLERAGIKLDSEMDWAALRSECQAHKKLYMRQGGDEKSWKETWETNGKGHAAWPGHTSLGVKGVSSSDHPPPRRSRRKNDIADDGTTDPRSPLGGKVKGQKTIRPSPRKDDSTPFLSRLPCKMDIAEHGKQEGKERTYPSQKGLAKHGAKDKIEATEADRLDSK